MTMTCTKGCLGNVFIVDSKLMITRMKINLREVGCSLKLIEKIVNPRQWITILDGEFVEFAIVDTHSKRSIFLLNELDRGSPWRRTGANKTFIRKFLQLTGKFLHLRGCKTIRSFGNGICTGNKIDPKFHLSSRRQTR